MNNPAVKNKVHNYFVVEVFNTETQETKSYTQSNLILDYGLARTIIDPYGKGIIHIEVGESTAPPDSTVTSMPNRIGSKQCSLVNKEIKYHPNYSLEVIHKITIQTNEWNGKHLRQIGFINFSRAQIKDTEGNPISILKTDTDVVTIYGTIVLTINYAVSPNILVTPRGVYSLFVNTFADPYNAIRYNCEEITLGGATTGLDPTYSPAGRKIMQSKNFLTTQNNGEIYDVQFMNEFHLEFPNQYYTAPLITGHTITNAQPTCNATRTTYALPNHQDIAQLRVYVNGVEKTTGFNIKQFHGYRSGGNAAQLPFKNVQSAHKITTRPSTTNSAIASSLTHTCVLMANKKIEVVEHATGQVVFEATASNYMGVIKVVPEGFIMCASSANHPDHHMISTDAQGNWRLSPRFATYYWGALTPHPNGRLMLGTGWWAGPRTTLFTFDATNNTVSDTSSEIFRMLDVDDNTSHYIIEKTTPPKLTKYTNGTKVWSRNINGMSEAPRYGHTITKELTPIINGVMYVYNSTTQEYDLGGVAGTAMWNAYGTQCFYNGAASARAVGRGKTGVPATKAHVVVDPQTQTSVPYAYYNRLTSNAYVLNDTREDNFFNFITFDTPLLETDVLTIDYLPKHIVKTDQNTLDLGFELVYDRG